MLHLNLAANPRFTNPRLPLAPLRLDLPPVPSGPVRVADAPHTRHDPTVSESLSLSLSINAGKTDRFSSLQSLAAGKRWKR